MIFEDTQLEIQPLPDQNSQRILLLSDTNISREELDCIQILSDRSVESLWKTRYGKHRFPLKQTAERPYVYINTIDQLVPELFPFLQFRSVECACGDPDFTRAALKSRRLSAEFRTQAKKLCYRVNVQAVRNWLTQFPLREDELVYVARGSRTETMLLPWKLFTKYWDVFYTFAGTLNIFNDTPGWFLFFHSEDVALWGCTEDYIGTKRLNSADFRKVAETFRAYPREFAKASLQERQRCRNCLNEIVKSSPG